MKGQNTISLGLYVIVIIIVIIIVDLINLPFVIIYSLLVIIYICFEIVEWVVLECIDNKRKLDNK